MEDRRTAREILEQQFLEMRWRCLSLAADLDRIDRAGNLGDERLTKLRQAFDVLSSSERNRAEKVQLIFSDRSPA